VSVIVCGENFRVLSEEQDGVARWCFRCRQRVEFNRVITAPTDIYSYYGPNATILCERGHVNGDLFPGYTREWFEGGE
jgi:hypothetical protein